MNIEHGNVILSVEADSFVQSFQAFDIAEVGSPRWNRQHEYLEKLNMQAALSASQHSDEFVKEYVITYKKVSGLIHELISVEIWIQQVFPELLRLTNAEDVVFPIYIVLYHEATLINLLETLFFHQEIAESAEDSVLDLLDYCYRKLSMLVNRDDIGALLNEEQIDAKNIMNASSAEELRKQQKKLCFDVSVKAMSILRYIVDHLNCLSLSTTARILNTHDIPILLVEFIENPPWTKRINGSSYKYIDTKWQLIPNNEQLKMSKLEGQVWLALCQLLLSTECQKKYELTDYRKNVLLKLRQYLTEITVDQLPVLVHLQRYLQELSFLNPAQIKNDVILEQVPEIRQGIMKSNKGKWESIAVTQNQMFFNTSEVNRQEHAQRLAATYNFDLLETLISEPPKCALCGVGATKRCSRCQNEWYCRRECQVSHWKKHKVACDLIAETSEKTEHS